MNVYRNLEEDRQDAINVILDLGEPLEDPPLDLSRLREERSTLTLKTILSYDDYSSWGQWSPGELRGLSPKALFEEFKSFRGERWAERAFDWLRAKSIPAVILYDGSRGTTIADGRGRVSLAVGLGIKKLPVVILKD